MVGGSKGSRGISASSFCILLSAALALVAVGGCHRLYEVRPLGPSNLPTEGIVYVLPQTELVMDVEIERTVLTLGRFAKFAHKFGLTPTPAKKQCPDGSEGDQETEWRYTCTPKIQSAELEAVGVPDRDQRFQVTIISERKAVDRSLNFTLLEDGRITKADAWVYDRSAEIAVQVTSKVLEIAAATAGAFLGLEETNCKDVAANYYKWDTSPRTKRRKPWRPKRILPRVDHEEEQACLNYVRLEELRGKREVLVGALQQASVTGAAAILKILDDEIDSIEELFSVTQTTTTHTVQRSFIPKPDDPSETFYVTNKGELVTKATDGQGKTKPKLTLEVVAESSSPPPVKPPFGKKCGVKNGDGLVYRLPESGMAHVIVEAKGVERILTSERVNLPQFGRSVSLPNCFCKRKTTLNVTLSSNTGMLQSISLTEETLPDQAVFQQNLDALGTASDALAKAVAKAGTEDRELEALKKQKELLEAEKEKREAERQVNCYRETGKPCSDD